MEVMCSVLEMTVPRVVGLTVEREDRALMPVLVEERTGTWSRFAHITGVRMEVMLNLGLIHRV